MKTYYKVVKVVRLGQDQRWRSYRAPSQTLARDYEIGREVVAPIGGILVFEDFQFAEDFCYGRWDARILVCDGWEPVSLPPKRFWCFREPELNHAKHDRLSRWACEEVWRGVYHREIVRYDAWPQGTVAVRRLRPIKCIPVLPWERDE